MTTQPTSGRRGRPRRAKRPDDATTTAFQHAPARAALDAWLLAQDSPPEGTAAKFAGLRDALLLLEQELLAGDDALVDREVAIEIEGCLDGEIRVLASPHSRIVAQEDVTRTVFPIVMTSIDDEGAAFPEYGEGTAHVDQSPGRETRGFPLLIDEFGDYHRPSSCGVVQGGLLVRIRGGIA